MNESRWASINSVVRLTCLGYITLSKTSRLHWKTAWRFILMLWNFDQDPGLHIWEIWVCYHKESWNNSWRITSYFGKKTLVVFIRKCLQEKNKTKQKNTPHHTGVFLVLPTERQVFHILSGLAYMREKRGKSDCLDDLILILLLKGL